MHRDRISQQNHDRGTDWVNLVIEENSGINMEKAEFWV